MSSSRDGLLGRRIAKLRDGADYHADEVVDRLTEAVVDRMLELGLSRAELADRLAVSPARVTSLLRGTNNFTVRTLTEVARALDCDLAIALVPSTANPAAGLDPGADAGHPVIAAESRAAYRTTPPRASYSSRDDEIREHLASGKLKVDGDEVLMRRETDQEYRPATFRRAGTHSTKLKTNVGRRAYYRDRIIAVAHEAR